MRLSASRRFSREPLPTGRSRSSGFWVILHEISLQAGEAFVRQGDPQQIVFVLLERLFQWRGKFGGDIVGRACPRIGDASN